MQRLRQEEKERATSEFQGEEHNEEVFCVFRDKTFDDFKKGLSMCKICVNAKEHARRGQWSEEKREKVKEENREYYRRVASSVPTEIAIPKDVSKRCTICQEIRLMKDFYLQKRKGTIRSACKECTRELKRQYYEENKEAYIKKTDAYKKKKIQTNPVFHLEPRMRCRVYNALTRSYVPKKERTLEYLGCTSDFFQKWIAFQLYDGMEMGNYGEVWHVDHTKPIASFNLLDEDECKKCFSWVNCRPLLAGTNIAKSASYRPFDSVLQELKAYIFTRDHYNYHQPR
jgi:hypothetical protein